MITFGLVLLLFAAYEVWGKAAIVADHQNALDAQLDEDWSQDPVVVAPTQPPPSPGATANSWSAHCCSPASPSARSLPR